MNQSNQSWSSAFGVFKNPRVLGMTFLGFSAGLPISLVFAVLITWLTDIKIPIIIVGYFGWVATTYSIKVFWAPVIDVINIPYLTKRLGHRRSWMLVSQIGVAIGLVAMANTGPYNDLNLLILAWFGLLAAFSSATQDVCIDAYRIEAASSEYQAAMASTYMLGYRVALIVSGAGALMLAEFSSWGVAYFVMGCLMAVGMITTLLIEEPIKRKEKKAMPAGIVYDHFKSFRQPIQIALLVVLVFFSLAFVSITLSIVLIFTIVPIIILVGFTADYLSFTTLLLVAVPILFICLIYLLIKSSSNNVNRDDGGLKNWYVGTAMGPIVDFVFRYGFHIAMTVLGLICLYRISDIFMGGMAQSLYVALQYTKFEIAIYTKVFGLTMTLLGTVAGGVLVMRLGVMRMLLVGAIMVAATNLLFSVLAMSGHDIPNFKGYTSAFLSDYKVSLLIAVIAGDNLSTGVATAAFIAYLSALVNKQYTATQFALFTSLMTLLGKLLIGFSGKIVDAAGYSMFFAIAALAGVPVILLVLYLMKLKHNPVPVEDEGAEAPPVIKSEGNSSKLQTVATFGGLAVLFTAITYAVLLDKGVIPFNNPSETKFTVRGVELNVGGNIVRNWGKLKRYTWDSKGSKNLAFIYFSLSNGASYPGPAQAKFEVYRHNFDVMWNRAWESEIPKGTIHTFDLCIDAKSQFAHYQKALGSFKPDLVPVVRVQEHRYCPGFYQRDVGKIKAQLGQLLKLFEVRYGKKPIIMGSAKAYAKLAQDNLRDYPFWVVSVFDKPQLNKETSWTLWQYTKRGLVDGLRSDRGRISILKGGRTDFEKLKL